MSRYLIPFDFETFGETYDVRSVHITTHAKYEAQRKFDKTHKQAESWIRSNLAKAKYVGEILDGYGTKETKLYAYQRIAFIVTMECDTVITVYPRNYASITITEPIRDVVEREIRKHDRKVARLERENRLKIAELNIEIAELEYRLLKTRSDSVKFACEARINAIREEQTHLGAEIIESKMERSTLLKGVAAFV